MFSEVKPLCAMCEAAIRGHFRLSPATLLTLLAAVAYVVAPIDAIPDVLPVIGFTDDAAVVAFVCQKFKKDLDRFQEWERSRGHVRDLDGGKSNQ